MEKELLLNKQLVAVVKQIESRCVGCFMRNEDAEVISFGLKSPFDVTDVSEVFFWCSCGYKWIEEIEEKVVI